MNTEQIRAAFEAIFPVPKNCIWCGNGYLPTEYNAWDAQNYAERFKGFQAALASPEVQALIDAAYERGLQDGRREGDDFIAGCLA